MKILYLSRVDLYNPRGGDTFQMEKTKEAVEKLDPSIQIDIKTELFPKDIEKYDLVHIFNLDWICESYLQVKYAKSHNKKVILSAIHHSEKEVLRYEELERYDIRRIYNFFIQSQSARDTWKNVYRSLFFTQKLYPTLIQLKDGIRNQQREIIKNVDAVLVQTDAEAKSIYEDFGVNAVKYYKVVNGVDADQFYGAKSDQFNKYVKENFKIDLSNNKIFLTVGRIEPRKNQINIIKVFKQLKTLSEFEDWKLVFIGQLSNKSYEYKFRFNSEIANHKKDILYLGQQSPALVASAMAHKGLYLHPSWFETTGLVCLEALLAGMPVVTSSTRLKEYVKNGIQYCEPQDIKSIKSAILKSVSEAPDLTDTMRNIKQNYSWDVAGQQTIKVYKETLGI